MNTPTEPRTPMPAADLEEIRLSLPVDDPDRHTLDTVADEAFAHLAPGYPATTRTTGTQTGAAA